MLTMVYCKEQTLKLTQLYTKADAMLQIPKPHQFRFLSSSNKHY